MVQYKIYYRYHDDSLIKDKDFVVTAKDPIQALDMFHAFVQRNDYSGMGNNRVVKRKALDPKDYGIQSMVQMYKDTHPKLGGTGADIESQITIPSTTNPRMKVEAKEKATPSNTDEFKFTD